MQQTFACICTNLARRSVRIVRNLTRDGGHDGWYQTRYGRNFGSKMINLMSCQNNKHVDLVAQILEKLNANANRNNIKDLSRDIELTANTHPPGRGRVMTLIFCSPRRILILTRNLEYSMPLHHNLSYLWHLIMSHIAPGYIVKPTPGSAAAGSEQQLIT